ncbi:Uncharacterized protein OBRU01_19499 [Operophtera brumata]|uniref:ZAD domain-containing protein n=1 Tax=Operophtera brumata TaxID=104452 RepID=A0A0L7KWL3_OPEBR|nr:Uncharacterized protein OBRU01_19499 [Operophtera brumata]
MAEVIDVQKMCRACLVDTGPFTSLFSPTTRETLLFSQIFKYCTSVEVSDSDQLPKQMCTACADLLKTLYSFKKMVLKSNVILKQHIDSQGEKKETKR